jgi:hypothetical protein
MKTGKTGCAMGMILMIPMSARHAAEAATQHLTVKRFGAIAAHAATGACHHGDTRERLSARRSSAAATHRCSDERHPREGPGSNPRLILTVTHHEVTGEVGDKDVCRDAYKSCPAFSVIIIWPRSNRSDQVSHDVAHPRRALLSYPSLFALR